LRAYLWFLQTSIDAGFEIAKITEDTLLKLFHILDGSAKGLETEDESADDVCAGDVVETAPEDTCDELVVWEEESVEGGVGGRGFRVPSGGGGCEEELEAVELLETFMVWLKPCGLGLGGGLGKLLDLRLVVRMSRE
jgi:hypothetical protein